MTTTPTRGVLDTSVVILLDRLADTTGLPDEPLITAITLAELSVGPLTAADDLERARRQARLQQAEIDFEPIPFDAAAARAFATVSVSMRRAHRTTKARSYDALIAATALAHGLPVHTCNPGDFAGIDGLDVVTVPHPEHRTRSDQDTTTPK